MPVVDRLLERARRDLAEGRAWKARDRLVGALAHRADDELLDLLGEVHAGMGDLPAAGAAWFATGRADEPAVAAGHAWRERHGADALQLWASLPPRVRGLDRPVVRALHDAAVKSASARGPRLSAPAVTADGTVRREPDTSGLLVDVLAFAVLALLLGLLVVGAVTVVRWIF